ncbi:hypothetical protein [Peristeroidobacter agariperforans]|uniref:hypothetical protein n=1 Tax=Peristeroidobacter agariperforans TaxID=268404 RepID=UPI00101B7610|nr:hypothetical protein [Peristeroidobacter agariperforans]
MRDTYKQIAEFGLLALAFFLAVPPLSSTPEPYDLMPGLAFAGLAFTGSLVFALYRKAETWPFAAAKLLLFLMFGWGLHLRMTIH